jgi:hypothetical protein
VIMDGSLPSSERGQALVLLTLAIVVLLGFTALAVDGSMIYSDRRYAQNGADTSSLAGGGAGAYALGLIVANHNWTTITPGNCRDGNVAPAAQRAKEAAVARAGDNDFTITPVTTMDEFEAAPSAVTTVCDTFDVPVLHYQKHFMDVYVKITHETPTAFAHFVFNGMVRNTTTAVTRIYPAQPFAFGNAIVALNPHVCDYNGVENGAKFHGTGIVHVFGGGIFTNGCLFSTGTPSVNVTDGGIYYVEQYKGYATISPPAEQADDAIPLSDFEIDPPDCSKVPNRTYNGSDPTLLPGNYTNLQFNSPIDRTFQPGLYCISGVMQVNGGTVTGNGITIYLKETAGDVFFAGNVRTILSAPNPLPDPSPAIPHMLIMAPFNYHGSITLNGTQDSRFTGTILAPGAVVKLEGNGGTDTYHTQVIGWDVKAGGTSDTYVRFNESEEFLNYPKLDLHQ